VSSTMTIWVTQFDKYHRAYLWKVEATETTKQYRVVSKEQITQEPFAYLRDTIHKNGTGGYWPHADCRQAIAWLRECLANSRTRLLGNIAAIDTRIRELDHLAAD
jgi:hypothetical protein